MGGGGGRVGDWGIGLGGGGVRVDVNEELKFLWKFKNIKKNFWWGGGRGEGRGEGWGGQGGCERRIEVFVKIQKKIGGGGGRGEGSGWGGGGVDVNEELKFL